MSLCGTIIRDISWLERQTQILTSKVCRIAALEDCSDWQDQGYDKCVEKRDEGYNQCSQQEDQGYANCCDWAPCSWFCDAWVWVSNIVCVAWTWVSNIVCVVWSWISKWVCRITYWIYTTICKLVVSIVFWFIRRVLTWIITLPCKAGTPDLDPRIRHIFVLVLENRSFDHMFGATAISGTDAETGQATQIGRRAEGVSNDYLSSDGNVHHCVVGPGQKKTVGDDPGHEFGNTLLALCGLDQNGKSPTYPPYPSINNGGYAQNFLDSSPPDPCSIMLSYTEREVPVITALAREFAVCDQWFSSMPGPTWPNRYFFHAASSAGLDDSPSTFDVGLSSLLSGLVLDNGTIYDMLDSENIDWAVYHGDEFPQVLSLAGMDVVTTSTHFHDMDDFEGDLADGSIANYVFIEPDYGDVMGNTYKCGNSQHPRDDITHGERLIKRVYEAIRNSPLWGQSLLIVTYDEGGGFFDDAIPGPTVPPGDSVTDPANDHHDFDFAQLGVRVPAIVCSPWIPRNLIDHRGYEHASVPATVERLWNLPSMTDRDDHARDLGSLLSLSSPRTDAPETLPSAAEPDVSCPESDDLVAQSSQELTSRPRGATVFDFVTLARARQHNSAAITSTAAAFLLVALRQDLLLAPRTERQKIYQQVRRFQTMGEVAIYGQAAIKEVQRSELSAKQRSDARRRRRRSK